MSESTGAQPGGAGAPPAAGAAAPPAPPAPTATPPAGTDLLEPGDDIGLLDGGLEPPAAEAAKPGTPATRPDYVPEAFWDAERGEIRAEATFKAMKDLRGRVSKGAGTVPESAEAYTLPEVEGVPAGLVPADDPLWRAVQAEAHTAGVSQEQLNAIAKPYLKHFAEVMDATRPPTPEQLRATQDAEFAKLGPNGRLVAKEVGTWIGGLHANGTLSEAEVKALRRISDAEGVRALMKLREMSGQLPIPTEALGTDTASVADLKRQMTEGYAKGDMEMVNKAKRQLAAMEKAGTFRIPQRR